jgi:Notch 1
MVPEKLIYPSARGMNMRRYHWALVLALLGLSGPALAQGLTKTCLDDESAGEALELAVDSIGDIHLSRVLSSSRELVYTHVDPQGQVNNEIVTGPVSPFVGSRLIQTDIETEGSIPYICFRDKLANRVRLAFKTGGNWSIETIQSSVTGDGCTLTIDEGTIVVAYEASGKLNLATRTAPNNWQRQIVDSVSGQRVGVTPDMKISSAGHRVIAHRNRTQNVLRITENRDGVWRTVQADHGFFNGGLEPRLAFTSAQSVEVFHGLESSSLGSESDVGLLRTTGIVGGAYSSNQVSGTSLGGSVDAMFGAEGLVVATRQLIRSALFGSFDGLLLLNGPTLAETRLENYGPADGRHVFQFIRLDGDPFGLTVLSFFDSQTAFAGAREAVCLYRPIDTDRDRLPDSVESVLGTNPNLADTDNDGRTDGEEVLIDETDPLGSDSCIPELEVCDGQDQDCDQRIDEQLQRGCYSGPEDTLSVGLCVSGVQVCSLGDWGGCAGEINPIEERCSGVDEDCDGAIDESFPTIDQPCNTGENGVCAVGRIVCLAGRTACEQVNFPSQDLCSGSDEDCDGSVDEGTITCGADRCFNEVPRCVDGQINLCEPLAGDPNDPTCDGADDDCDGRIDEDFTTQVTQCGTGSCLGTGEQRCENGVVVDTCVPLGAQPDVTCDGLDDDCDGRLDEGVPTESIQCGVGACEALGIRQCVEGNFVEACQPKAPVGDDFTCDQIDDDCDGRVDESFVRITIECGQGVCQREGLLKCEMGVVLEECTPGSPIGADSCDGVDDDCDGIVDEDFEAVETLCGVGVCAATGLTQCENGAIIDRCMPLAGDQVDGSCDGVDQDCDSVFDEDFEVQPSVCGIGLCASTGSVSCVDGAVRDDCIVGAPVGADLFCDGLDGDCDGIADEGFVGPLESCGVGACVKQAAKLCVDATEISGCEPGLPALNDASCDGVDDDCDGDFDEDFVSSEITCGLGLCTNAGTRTCEGGVLRSTCEPLAPGVDDSCDGIDQDCDGRFDEAYEAQTVDCGEGQCKQTIVAACVGGRLQSCEPGSPALSDDTCDGIDNDCDALVDEGAAPITVTCGLGLCEQQGLIVCTDGVWDENCQPLEPPALDRQCDGLDGDCDGIADEHFVGEVTTCGVGACGSEGRIVCENGQGVDSCRPDDTTLEDDQCNGVDDDCDSRVDEAVEPELTTCGIGRCLRNGQILCDVGRLLIDCEPGPPAASDVTCNGEDDDCDSRTDEAFVGEIETCGLGVCERRAATICQSGRVESTCIPGASAGEDSSCDGVDQDCDGRADEGFVGQVTTCGVGLCAETGRETCVGGNVIDTCVAAPPNPNGDLCDGIDDDCDGRIDEDHVQAAVQCGVGACTNTGALNCIAGRLTQSCTPLDPGPADRQCDGVDTDCDGRFDEDFQITETVCGQGVCAQTGLNRCESGRQVDTCVIGQPLGPIDMCDGADTDCDGRTDEDHQIERTTCGIGVCANAGRVRCINGALLDSCVPLSGGQNDTTCNGADEDCDGLIDEGYVSEPSTCGQGVCTSSGETRCFNGRVSSTCRPGLPLNADLSCNGLDEDCDGQNDEGFQARTIRCGLGICVAFDVEQCAGGAVVSNCQPAIGSGDDRDCNGQDDDCDGRIDEQAQAGLITCGLGVCLAEGERACVNGRWESSCRPNAAIGADSSCDGSDQDCDGRSDEAFPNRPSACGRGLCLERGERQCHSGSVTDTCEPSEPQGDDVLCDRLDQDCDGRLDEAFVGGPVECGQGVCVSNGLSVCANGTVRRSCEAGSPTGNDDNCNGQDEDCDGLVDEGSLTQPTVCGEGRCQSSGVQRCESGAVIDTCVAGDAEGADENCNGVDDDCDGLVDEGFVLSEVVCGIGVCQQSGISRCDGGGVVTDCTPGDPSGADRLCDGLDQDCDGVLDESFSGTPVVCGLGACERDGLSTCVDGVIEESCRPGVAADTDAQCDGVDEDCDGQLDEDCPDRPSDMGITESDAGGSDTSLDGSDVETSDMTTTSNLDQGNLYYCTDGGFCIDGSFESLCDSGADCSPSVADPDELIRPIDSGCNCVQGNKVPFTWIGALVCVLLGLSRRRLRH